jgi:poly-gamma-glutamate biosynthesis protein PgsC/CapC
VCALYNDIVVLGVVVSILFTELTGLSPAGLIVPGYIALCLQTPGRIAYTLVIVLLALGAAKLLGQGIILYGRRKFAAMILLSFLINLLLEQSGLLTYNPGVIGCLVPGIIAQECDRQGIIPTLVSLGIAVGILALIMLWSGTPVLGI